MNARILLLSLTLASVALLAAVPGAQATYCEYDADLVGVHCEYYLCTGVVDVHGEAYLLYGPVVVGGYSRPTCA